MQNAMLVRGGEGRCNLCRQPEGLLDRHRTAQRDAVEVLHDQEVHAVLTANVMERADVWMIERRNRARFAFEALACSRIVGDARGQHLYRDRAIESAVARAVDITHSTGPMRGPSKYGPMRLPSKLLVAAAPPNDGAPASRKLFKVDDPVDVPVARS